MNTYTLKDLSSQALASLYIEKSYFVIAGLPGLYQVKSMQYVGGPSGRAMERIQVELENSAHDDQVTMRLSRKMST